MPNQPLVSVCTLVRNRRTNLENQLRGLAQSDYPVAELIVVHMNEAPYAELPATDFPVRQVRFDYADNPLPLAHARNRAVREARHDHLVLLDVDCIPHRAMISTLVRDVEQTDGLVMGTIRYLQPGANAPGWNFERLDAQSVLHKRRPLVPGGEVLLEKNYALFWSLCFACTRAVWQRIGGFDERFPGYGGEDTDFAFEAEQCGVPFYLSEAVCYHQYHPISRPPLNNFDNIVENSTVFRRKWGRWCMEGWLQAFADRGLISWTEQADAVTVHRRPTAEEIAATTVARPY